ncbi:MAG: TolC family outer membrane protein [Rhodospirillales bacterium]|nr:TolC family outer membrane protein [Rhodospirillales bacterium]
MALILGASAPVWAQDLKSEIAGLLVEHPQIKATKKTTEATKHAIGEATAAFLPQVVVNADTGIEDIKNASLYGTGHDDGWHSKREVAGVTVTQNLFDGFARVSAANTARIAYSSQGASQETTQQSVIFEAVTAYINVLRQSKLIELSLSKESSIKEQLELEDERVKRGSGISTDVLEAKQRLQLAKDMRVAEEGELRIASATYQQVFNHAPDIAGLSMPSPPLNLLPESLEEAIKLAQQVHPTIEGSGLEVERTREQRTQVRADYFPTVDLVGSMNFERDKNATRGTRRDYSVIVQATWNAFTGFSTQEGEMRAAYEYGAAQDFQTYNIRKVIEATQMAWQKLQTVRERITLLENAVNIAAEIYDDKKNQRDAGKETAVTVLDAETALYDQRMAYVRASYDAQLYIYELLWATGRLTPTTIGIL